MYMSDFLLSNTDTTCSYNNILLYKDCEFLRNSDGKLYAYAPKNTLDIELFNALTQTECLTCKGDKFEIKVKNEMNPIFVDQEMAELGDAELIWIDEGKNIFTCNECKLIIPFDMEFYSNKTNAKINCSDDDSSDDDSSIKNKDVSDVSLNQCNVCKICYDKDKHKELNVVKKTTGLDNMLDWIRIFTVKHTYEHYGNMQSDYHEYFCNLNPNSPHYKKFGSCYYVSMYGTVFDIIEEKSIEEIINCKWPEISKR